MKPDDTTTVGPIADALKRGIVIDDRPPDHTKAVGARELRRLLGDPPR